MTVQPALNHFFTDLSSPDKTSFEVLEGNISNLKVKSWAYYILEKICYVALLALIAVVFAISYNLIVLSGMAPLVIAGLVLTSPLLVIAPAKFNQLSNYYWKLSEQETRVSKKLKVIEQWRTPQIEAFLREQRLDPNAIQRQALAEIHPSEPMQALLPLIARYQDMQEQIATIMDHFATAPIELEETFRRREQELGHPIPAQDKQGIRFQCYMMEWNEVEGRALPLALGAATLLQIMQNPTRTDLDVAPMSFELPNVGTCQPRNWAERIFGKQSEPRNDDYFVFHDAQRPPITHQQLIDLGMNSREIRPVLYP
ncbi:MAG: hypothetical protein KGR16_03810 [Verrucomicrobia bacterium]|nr:hypothetical protein [Verrucomicrobiota bacterium]